MFLFVVSMVLYSLLVGRALILVVLVESITITRVSDVAVCSPNTLVYCDQSPCQSAILGKHDKGIIN